MDVPPVGAGSAGINLSGASSTVPATATVGMPARMPAPQSVADSYAAASSDLSEADLARLIQILEPPRSAHAPQIDGLLHAAAEAASAGDTVQAAGQLAAMALLDSRYTATVLSQQPPVQMRGEVDTFLNHMSSTAKWNAEARVAEAAQRSETIAARKLADWDAAPQKLVEIARHLLDSGGYENYLRAAEVAQVVIDGSRWVPANAGVAPVVPAGTIRELKNGSLGRKQLSPFPRRSWEVFRKAVTHRIRVLWLRAPLLILLLAWLTLGATAGVTGLIVRKYSPESWSPSLANAGVELWVIGFLVLVLFGFYMRVRNIRF